ncbi:alginate lyase [Betaproteobacteria bacterium]|nr:alginate lyase [Betaproteobacteria bacterium]GHU03281.1 alginate lyase [Betaproteobacteria bacterium]GHU21788.1 alginate lyase [Betaproteobacteria bacterium]
MKYALVTPSLAFVVALCACTPVGPVSPASSVSSAALVPPPGYYAPVVPARVQQDVKTCSHVAPTPHTGALHFRSRYEGSDRARATLNPEAEADYRDKTRNIREMERGVVKYATTTLRKGTLQDLDCAVAWLDTWAQADALMSADFNHTGKSMRKWALGSLASAWVSLKFSASKPLAAYPQQAQRIEAWLARLAEQTVSDWSDLPLERVNNHSYWAAWAVMASATALDRHDLFDWAVDRFRIAATQVNRDGFLPNELRREQRALAYHNYALTPLVMVAAFAAANGVDLRTEQDAALRRLAEQVISGIENPAAFVCATGVLQDDDNLKDNADFAWLEPYCTLYPCRTETLRWKAGMQPFQATRLGGDVTRMFQPQQNP